MNVLPLNKAFKLYELLSPYMGDVAGDPIHVIQGIVAKMIESGDGSDYINAVCLMNGVEEMSLVMNSLPPDEIMIEFIRGLELNRFFDLVAFCRSMN